MTSTVNTAAPHGRRATFTHDGYNEAVRHDLTTEDLKSASVYGHGDEKIGAVSDLVVTAEGKISQAIVDVGGFLGIGQKPVAMQFGSLNLQNDNTGALRVSTSATQDQLKGAPTFQDNMANQ